MTIYDRIAYSKPDKSINLLRDYGLTRKPKNHKEISKLLRQLCKIGKEDAKYELVKIHPDYKIIVEHSKVNDYNTEGEEEVTEKKILGLSKEKFKDISIGAGVVVGIAVLIRILR